MKIHYPQATGRDHGFVTMALVIFRSLPNSAVPLHRGRRLFDGFTVSILRFLDRMQSLNPLVWDYISIFGGNGSLIRSRGASPYLFRILLCRWTLGRIRGGGSIDCGRGRWVHSLLFQCLCALKISLFFLFLENDQIFPVFIMHKKWGSESRWRPQWIRIQSVSRMHWAVPRRRHFHRHDWSRWK